MLEKKEEIDFLKSLYRSVAESAKAIGETVDLNNDEADMIAEGHKRRAENKEEISLAVAKNFGEDYKNAVMSRRNLEDVRTKDLVEELQKREGVEMSYIEPEGFARLTIFGEESVTTEKVEGSCVVLKIID